MVLSAGACAKRAALQQKNISDAQTRINARMRTPAVARKTKSALRMAMLTSYSRDARGVNVPWRVAQQHNDGKRNQRKKRVWLCGHRQQYLSAI